MAACSSFHQRFLIPIFCLIHVLSSCQGQCKNERLFGSNCQYRCNCKEAKCGLDGECVNTTCEVGWFGMKCQYQNLLAMSAINSLKSMYGWLVDNDDSTCNDDQTKTLFIDLKQEYPFSSLRLTFYEFNKAHLSQLNIGFATSHFSAVNCSNQRVYVWKTTADFRCEQNVLARYLNISGDVVLSLCSLYINGGRNIALNAKTHQSSDYVDSRTNYSQSYNAVDGNTSSDFYDRSCTHTVNEHRPYWTITLPVGWIVNRYQIFNRQDREKNNDGKYCCPERLQNFILQTLDVENNTIETYQESNKQPLLYYTINSLKDHPIRKVQITTARSNGNEKSILTICEFEAYAECERGKWGLDCEKNCPTTCPLSCHQDNGACETKCILQTDHLECEEGSDSNVAGIAVGLILLIIILTSTVFIFIRYRRYKEQKIRNLRNRLSPKLNINDGPFKQFSRMFSRKENVDSMLILEINDGKDIGLQDKLNENEEKEKDTLECTDSDDTSIAIPDFNVFVQSRGRDYFSRQFKSAPEPDNVSTDIGLSDGNKAKNRYKNIITYDHSRVNLQVNVDTKEGDYINASYINGHKNEVKFIASQGPNKTMINDFIRMIWEQKTDNIVMLTSLVENGKVKCEQYWSNKGKTQYGNIKVRLCSTETFADYSIRKLELSKKDEPCHKVTQFHFDTWPDKNVPLTPWGLVEFQNRVWTSKTSRPIVVHCSAGVGRTGTFIALCNVIEQARETGRVNFFETLTKLRQDRMWMVQNVEQYEFLHQAAQVALLCLSTYCDATDISKVVNSLREKRVDGRTKLDQEYKNLCEVCNAVEKHTENLQDNTVYNPASEEENIYLNSDRSTESSRNRFPDIIPNENFRVVLHSDSKHLGEYINAIFIQGLMSDSEIILTQLPMPGTVVDFWRMIVQYKVTLVVAFEADSFDTDKSVAEYLPSNTEQVNVCPPFRIHSAYMKKSDVWEERKLTIHKKLDNHRLIHLQSKFTDLNDRNLLTFMKQVRSYESTGRTVYMCRNGAAYSGLACILSILLDRIDRDLSVSVPLTTGSVKSVRSQVISSVEQYRCIYDVLGRYTDTSDQYHNVTDDLFQRNKKDQPKPVEHRDSLGNNIYFNQ